MAAVPREASSIVVVVVVVVVIVILLIIIIVILIVVVVVIRPDPVVCPKLFLNSSLPLLLRPGLHAWRSAPPGGLSERRLL